MDTICPVIFFFSATQIRVSLHIYFPFPVLPAVLEGYYISSHFIFPLLLGSECVYLFVFPFLFFLLFWIDTIKPVIFYFLCYLDSSVSTYLFSVSFTSCLDGLYMSRHFLFPLLLGSQCVYLFISPFL